MKRIQARTREEPSNRVRSIYLEFVRLQFVLLGLGGECGDVVVDFRESLQQWEMKLSFNKCRCQAGRVRNYLVLSTENDGSDETVWRSDGHADIDLMVSKYDRSHHKALKMKTTHKHNIHGNDTNINSAHGNDTHT